ncbi:transporter substrate-binding domain-containing protein [Parahaliea mediterranea]|uniref:transporter substrate-binding domain-containing protein n=1 Tax=Parahaliea mediterranea TaxID=651086 RepID=UPI000E2F3A8B|nr:transporter substrate-binding domain-containing protein [Parahaliea mediterranea]
MKKHLVVIALGLWVTSAWAEALRVGLSPDYPPLAFTEEGRVVGMEADHATAVGGILGRPVKLVPMSFEQLLPALQAGEVDVLMSGLSVTARRSEQVDFTEPYLLVGQMAIMHRDKIARFAQPWAVFREGVRVGVEPDTTGADFAARELPDAAVSFYADPEQAFAALRADRIDLYIHDAPTSWQLANSAENDDLISTYSPLTEEMLAWAVRKGNASLQGELNNALQLMRGNGTLSYIQGRWIPVQVEVKAP